MCFYNNGAIIHTYKGQFRQSLILILKDLDYVRCGRRRLDSTIPLVSELVSNLSCPQLHSLQNTYSRTHQASLSIYFAWVMPASQIQLLWIWLSFHTHCLRPPVAPQRDWAATFGNACAWHRVLVTKRFRVKSMPISLLIVTRVG